MATLKAEDAQAALENLDKFVLAYPESKVLGPVYSLMTECYSTLGNPEKRLACEIKALEHRELDPNNPRADNSGAYWKIANLAEFRAGDFETARKYYGKLLEEYPTDQKGFATEKALERLNRTEALLKAGKRP
mgnify:CR=1 FL=1